MIVYSVNLLEVACQGLELYSKAQVTPYRHAVLACHRHNSGSIVLEYLR